MSLQHAERGPHLGWHRQVEIAQELARLHGNALELTYRCDDGGESVAVGRLMLALPGPPSDAPPAQPCQDGTAQPAERGGRQPIAQGEEPAFEFVTHRAVSHTQSISENSTRITGSSGFRWRYMAHHSQLFVESC